MLVCSHARDTLFSKNSVEGKKVYSVAGVYKKGKESFSRQKLSISAKTLFSGVERGLVVGGVEGMLQKSPLTSKG